MLKRLINIKSSITSFFRINIIEMYPMIKLHETYQHRHKHGICCVRYILRCPECGQQVYYYNVKQPIRKCI